MPTPAPASGTRICGPADPADRAARRHRAAHEPLRAAGFLIQPESSPGPHRQHPRARYRLVAAVDAWRVASFLNRVDGSGDGRSPGAGSVRGPSSLAGLLAVLLVMTGATCAVAYYDIQAQELDMHLRSRTRPPANRPTPPPPARPRRPATTPAAPPCRAGAPLHRGTPPASASAARPRLPPSYGGAPERPAHRRRPAARENTFNTDTMIVVSIDPNTKQVAMFSLPRDTVDVPLPPGRPRTSSARSIAARSTASGRPPRAAGSLPRQRRASAALTP